MVIKLCCIFLFFSFSQVNTFHLMHLLQISKVTGRKRLPEKSNYQMISNGNTAEWSPIQFIIIRVIDKIGRVRDMKWRVWLQTELDDPKSYKLIIVITLWEDLKKDKKLMKKSEISRSYHIMIVVVAMLITLKFVTSSFLNAVLIVFVWSNCLTTDCSIRNCPITW